MNLVDANVLIYAGNESVDRHAESRRWLDAALGGQPVGLSWIVLLAFLRLSTKVGLSPSPRTVAVLAGLLAQTGTGGNLVNDAHLAALAVEHDATVVTYDSDFGRFSGVRWPRPGGH